MSNLPFPSVPQYSITLPISKIKMDYRPFLVGEQKLLFMALESNQLKDTMQATVDILKRCTNKSTPNTNIEDLIVTEAVYYLIQLRIKSVGESVEVNQPCAKCGKKYISSIPLSDVQIKSRDTSFNDITLDCGLTIKIHYPTISETIDSISSIDDSDDSAKLESAGAELITKMIETIIDKDAKYNFSDYSREEKKKFIESMTVKDSQKIEQFINSIPEISYIHKSNCLHCGSENTIELRGLSDFFG